MAGQSNQRFRHVGCVRNLSMDRAAQKRVCAGISGGECSAYSPLGHCRRSVIPRLFGYQYRRLLSLSLCSDPCVSSVEGPHKATHRLSVGGVLLFSYMSVFLAYYISFAKIVCHYKFDYLLFAFDGSLGPHWNFWIGKIASAFHPLTIALETAYYSLGCLCRCCSQPMSICRTTKSTS